jgi:hypothetical protein
MAGMASTVSSKKGVPLESKKLARILPALLGEAPRSGKQRSLRLVAQDIALSRQVHEFESRRERH